MKPLQRVFGFYINSSLHVSFAVCALVAITQWEFQLMLPFAFYAFVFFGSLTGYNFVKYAKAAGLHHRNLTDSLKTIQIFSFICFGFLVFFALKLSFETLAYTAFLGLLTLFYAIPLLFKKKLRSIKGIKIIVVTIVWAGVSVLLPNVESQGHFNLLFYLTLLQRFLFVIVLILPFEIRDLRYDKHFLGTLPQQLGIKRTKYFGLFLLMVILAIEFFKPIINTARLISLLFAAIILGLLLWNSKSVQSRYFASFWVESVPIFWALLFFSACIIVK